MRNYLIMDGTDSRTFGLYTNGAGTFGAGAREVSTLQIPGRNGDLIVKADRLQNYDLTYSCFIARNFDANIAALRAFLHSKTSYFRLEDTYHPDEYRMAFYRGPFTPAVNQRLNAAKFDLTFNVKPQRFLKSGETRVTIAAGTINNPTAFDAKPILRFYGNGTFRLNTLYYFTIANNANTYMDIDCDMMEAYTGTTNRNADLSSSGMDYPYLKPGANTLSVTGSFTKIEMIPRWWTA